MDAIARLREYQMSRGLTQSALAEQLEVTAAQVSTWLAGLRGPSIATALQVEQKTGGAVPVESWVDGHSSNLRHRRPRGNAARPSRTRRAGTK